MRESDSSHRLEMFRQTAERLLPTFDGAIFLDDLLARGGGWKDAPHRELCLTVDFLEGPGGLETDILCQHAVLGEDRRRQRPFIFEVPPFVAGTTGIPAMNGWAMENRRIATTRKIIRSHAGYAHMRAG